MGVWEYGGWEDSGLRIADCRLQILVVLLTVLMRFLGKIGVGRADCSAPPPSEPDVRVSRIRLSGWWFTAPRIGGYEHGLLPC